MSHHNLLFSTKFGPNFEVSKASKNAIHFAVVLSLNPQSSDLDDVRGPKQVPTEGTLMEIEADSL